MPSILPKSCPDYTKYASLFHGPASQGSFHLPYQRPIESCRTFTSKIIDQVVNTVAKSISNLDLAQLFRNTFPNTLDTTIKETVCFMTKVKTTAECHPLTFLVTGDIDAMWLRDSANQIMPYLEYIPQDLQLKKLFLGTIYMQAHFISIDPYANAFHPPTNMTEWSMMHRPNNYQHHVNALDSAPSVYESKWEIDSLASFFSLSYNYWKSSNDSSFIDNPIWINAVQVALTTLENEQHGTFDSVTGKPLPVNDRFSQKADRPTETQFLDGRGQPIKETGMIRTLFRPSDDACVYNFFVPGNAMMSVELDHMSQLIQTKNSTLATQAKKLSDDIRNAIYKYAVVDLPDHGKVFAYEVDGYGSHIIMDDANVPSLLSLPLLGFIDEKDPIYVNTRKLVLSKDNPYYFKGPRMEGIGGPHVGLNYAWPMSQIVKILTSNDDEEIKESLNSILKSTDGTGLIHESVNVYDDNNPYTRPWFAWANGLFGQAILKLYKEKPNLLSSF
ncbi:hypothetical protein BJ944DRAFT_276014 [Cunninghamella echinulata]|nr:hypothetical protein BJ944DRAFT_276014 [Cunninghamella echinulata]